MGTSSIPRYPASTSGDKTPAFLAAVNARAWLFENKDSFTAVMRDTVGYAPKVRVWACLQLASFGYQSEIALKMEKGKPVDLTPADIAAKCGLSKQHTRRALVDLESEGKARREFPLSEVGKKAKAPRIFVNLTPPVPPPPPPAPEDTLTPAEKVLAKHDFLLQPETTLSEEAENYFLAAHTGCLRAKKAAYMRYLEEAKAAEEDCQEVMLAAGIPLISTRYKEETNTLETTTFETTATAVEMEPSVVSEWKEEEQATHPPDEAPPAPTATPAEDPAAGEIRAALTVALNIELRPDDPIPAELAQLTAAERVPTAAMVDFIRIKSRQKTRRYGVWSPGALAMFVKQDFPYWVQQMRIVRSPDPAIPRPEPPQQCPQCSNIGMCGPGVTSDPENRGVSLGMVKAFAAGGAQFCSCENGQVWRELHAAGTAEDPDER